MPKKVMTVTVKKGSQASDRKVLSEVSTASGNVPSNPTDGVFVNRAEFVHLMFKMTNSDTNNQAIFYVQLWWWSPISEEWHIGERLKVNSSDIHTVEIQGLNRLYLQVDAISFVGSGTPYIDCWVAAVVPV